MKIFSYKFLFFLINPRKHFTFFAAESDILGVGNDKKKWGFIYSIFMVYEG